MEPTCAFLIGYPGAGKSTAVSQLIDACEIMHGQLRACTVPHAAWLESNDNRIVVVGRFAGRHADTGGVTEQSMCQGADRIFAGVGTAAVRQCFSKFKALGAELVVIDTIRSTLLNENTVDAARAAGFDVRILELNTSFEVAQQRAIARSRSERREAVLSVERHLNMWSTRREQWRKAQGYQLHSSDSLRQWLMQYIKPLQQAAPALSATHAPLPLPKSKQDRRKLLEQALRDAGARLDVHQNHTNVFVLPGDDAYNCLVRVVSNRGMGSSDDIRSGRRGRIPHIHLALGSDTKQGHHRDLQQHLRLELERAGAVFTFEPRASKARHRLSVITDAPFPMLAECVCAAHAALAADQVGLQVAPEASRKRPAASHRTRTKRRNVVAETAGDETAGDETAGDKAAKEQQKQAAVAAAGETEARTKVTSVIALPLSLRKPTRMCSYNPTTSAVPSGEEATKHVKASVLQSGPTGVGSAGPSGASPSAPGKFCAICMDAPCTMLIAPCGHKCLCVGCKEQLQAQGRSSRSSKHHEAVSPPCPICRGPIQQIIKVIEAGSD